MLRRAWTFFGLMLVATAAGGAARASDDDPARFLQAGYGLGADAALGTEAGIRGREYVLIAGFGDFVVGAGRLSAGLDYRYTRYEFEGLPSRDWDLHWARLPLTWRVTRAAWDIEAEIAPGVASSSNRFKEPANYTSDDLYATARLGFTTRPENSVRWTAGLAYDRRFGRPLVYPTGGALVDASNGWTLRLVLPDPEIAFMQSPRLRWFASLSPAGHRWHAFNEAAGRIFDFQTRAWRAVAGAELEIFDGLSVRVFAGREFHRHYEFVDDLGRPVDEDAEAAGFAGVTFVMPAFADRD